MSAYDGPIEPTLLAEDETLPSGRRVLLRAQTLGSLRRRGILPEGPIRDAVTNGGYLTPGQVGELRGMAAAASVIAEWADDILAPDGSPGWWWRITVTVDDLDGMDPADAVALLAYADASSATRMATYGGPAAVVIDGRRSWRTGWRLRPVVLRPARPRGITRRLPGVPPLWADALTAMGLGEA